jgi:hypothetical protein
MDLSYRKGSEEIRVLGERVRIPRRIHFLRYPSGWPWTPVATRAAIQCLYTRSTDGYARQRALRSIVELNAPWSIPFVVVLSGEYVVEIIEDIVAATPQLDRCAYAQFVRENRSTMRLLRARAQSYWDRYYRMSFPERAAYPGLAFLHRLEEWAS